MRDKTKGKGHADLIFENRAHTSYAEMKDYLDKLKAEPGTQIYGAVLGDPTPKTKQDRKNLQIADAMLGACFAALEPNSYGMTDQSYLPYIKDRFYRRNGNLLSYGFKLLPHDTADRIANEHEWFRSL